LADSAINNRVRFVRAALEGEFTGPSYDGPGWVKLGAYAAAAWPDVTELWKNLNRSLASVLDEIPPERYRAQCRVGNSSPVTLEWLVDDYIAHMRHHLEHVLSGR
jgi:hypothetical protein